MEVSMFRAALVFAALAGAPAALACGSDTDCTHCNRSASTETAAVDVEAAEGTKVTLAITGMHCGTCATKIVAALTGTDGVHAATVDHETGRARVAYDADTLDEAALIAAVASAGGFEATVVPAGE